MRKIQLLCVLALVYMAAGCSNSSKLYDWKDYSSTLYSLKKSPDEKSAKAHMEMLKSIIDNAEKYHRNVPPGVYCEYGYMLLKTGSSADAKSYLEMEMKTYPESKVFMERLIADMDKYRMKTAENPKKTENAKTEETK